MNQKERTMRDILARGHQEYGVVSVKAEFEAEGTRMDELLRLVDIARSAGLHRPVNIGGCEGIRDLYEARQIGVRYIVAPMVESVYAVQKYIGAKNIAFSEDDQRDVDFLFNMETVNAFANLNGQVKLAAHDGQLQGIVFGRVDYVGSAGLPRDDVNSDRVLEDVRTAAATTRDAGLDFVCGGGVSMDALPFLREVRDVHLSRFETRKVVFDGSAVQTPRIEKALLEAVHFELLWLLNKRDYYHHITVEDAKRIEMLESRWKVLSSSS